MYLGEAFCGCAHRLTWGCNSSSLDLEFGTCVLNSCKPGFSSQSLKTTCVTAQQLLCSQVWCHNSLFQLCAKACQTIGSISATCRTCSYITTKSCMCTCTGPCCALCCRPDLSICIRLAWMLLNSSRELHARSTHRALQRPYNNPPSPSNRTSLLSVDILCHRRVYSQLLTITAARCWHG